MRDVELYQQLQGATLRRGYARNGGQFMERRASSLDLIYLSVTGAIADVVEPAAVNRGRFPMGASIPMGGASRPTLA